MKNKVILNDAFKRFTLDQDKILPPEETVKQFKDKLNKIDIFAKYKFVMFIFNNIMTHDY